MEKDNSPEMQKIIDAIDNFVKKNEAKGFIVDFIFDCSATNPEKDYEVVEDRVCAYGAKNILDILLEGLQKMFNDEADKTFINF